MTTTYLSVIWTREEESSKCQGSSQCEQIKGEGYVTQQMVAH